MKSEIGRQHQMKECQTSEEEESRSSGGGAAIGSAKKSKKGEGSGTEGASIEVVRRPRGRPPGSKNKPKPPLIITRDGGESSMQPHVLEIPGGHDVIDSLSRFARRRGIGLCVLAGSGTVANVTLRQPTAAHGATVTFPGRLDIVSISATFLPPSSDLPANLLHPDCNSFSISLAGAQGQIVGGFVAPPLVASGTVTIVAAAFTTPIFHRLPDDDDVPDGPIASALASAAVAVESNSGHQHSHAVEPMYTSHLPSHHVIWAPTAARQSLPPPPTIPY